MNYPVPTPIFHITHLNNLMGVLQTGGLRAANFLQGSYQSVAYGHIQARRSGRSVPVKPFGNLHDYVPFYFCNRSPMLFAIHSPSPGQLQYQGGQTPILHIVSSADAVAKAELPFVFTDRHAAVAYAEFFGQLPELARLNWAYIRAQIWHSNDPQHPGRKEQKQAEFLVHRFFPWELVEAIGVINAEVKEQVNAVLEGFPAAMHKPILIKPGWYY